METMSYRIIVADIDRVAETKHGIPETFKVGLPVSEVGGGLLQPLTEPLSVLCGLSVSVGGHQEHTDGLTDRLNTKGKQTTR